MEVYELVLSCMPTHTNYYDFVESTYQLPTHWENPGLEVKNYQRK